MNSLIVPCTMVKLSDKDLVTSSLPKGEGYTLCGEGSDFQIKIYGLLCATALVEDGQIYFHFVKVGPNIRLGDKLKTELLKKYPDLDQERIVWQIFWCFAGIYSAAVHHYETKKQALASLTQFQVNQGAYLCSYKAKFVGQSSFWTKTAHRIDNNFLPGKNLGSMKIVLTVLKL